MACCDECGLTYQPDLDEDRRHHLRYHDESVRGPRCAALATDSLAWEHGERRVLVVTPLSELEQRRRASSLSLIAARDLAFSFVTYHPSEEQDERNLHLFIGAEGGRHVAYMAFALRSHVWRLTWGQWDGREEVSPLDRSPIWTVEVVWVCKGQRRKGWVRSLIASATRHVGVPRDEFAWYTPFSESGELVARRFCPEAFYIGK